MFWRKKKEIDLQKVALNEYDRASDGEAKRRKDAIERAVKHIEKKFKVSVDKVIGLSDYRTQVSIQGYLFEIVDAGYSEYSFGRQWEVYLCWKCDECGGVHAYRTDTYADVGLVLAERYGRCQ